MIVKNLVEKRHCGNGNGRSPWMHRATGCDAFTLARIAGHSNITITQRYVHPEIEAVEAAFQKLVTYCGQQ